MRKVLACTSLAMIASISGTNFGRFNEPERYEPPKKVKKVIPKGCKEYHFAKSGTQVSQTCTYIYFSCVASNYKVAIKKFNSFKRSK